MIIYQVYPRSFADANGDGLGDLRGLRNKLPYLASLGVEMIWVSPFFKSPMKDFGYDVSDYCAVDAMFGDQQDFADILMDAEKLGTGIMVDMVLSHSSDQHPWFIESRQSRSNEKSDWYVWADAKPDGSVPNNWMSLFGGSAWQWSEERQQFYLHNFLREQPDFNFHQIKVQDALLDACEFWLKKGVRGFRLDVCNFYFHNANLQDNPLRPKEASNTEGVHAENPYNAQVHVFDKDQKENLGFLQKLRALCDRYPQTVLMGEVVGDDSLGVMHEYTSEGKPLHTAYNFSLFKPAFDGNEFARVLSEFELRLSKGSPSWALSNHDVPRFTSRFHGDQGWPQSTKSFLFFLFSLRGNLVLYQGDELGLDEVEIPFAQMQDPFGIEFYPEFKGRDGCRTPMPWASERPNHATWLPIPDSHLKRAVSVQEPEQESVLGFTRRMIKWRKSNNWLESASLKILSSSKNTIVIERQIDPEHFWIAMINGGAVTESVEVASHAISAIDLKAYSFAAYRINGSNIEREF